MGDLSQLSRLHTSRRTRWGFAAAAALAIAGAVWVASVARTFDPTNPNVTLADIEATVTSSYPLAELTDARLADRLGRDDTLVFDVREPDEFAQSHLNGARRIDPEMTASAFQAAYGQELKGRTVVFYCAVGVRSGRMLARVKSVLDVGGVRDAYNLRGGIFRWHASGRALVAEHAAGGLPRTVHPYDASWGQLLDRTVQPGAPATPMVKGAQ